MSNTKNSPVNFSTRLSKTGGKIVGVTTQNSNGVRKFNGQVQAVSARYVTMFDRNQRKQVKFALSSVQSVTGV